MRDDDLHFMKLAIAEARKGVGRTSPNPAVGAVVVKNGKLVGKGYHRRAGTPHAELHALQDAGRSARDATIYVTLEPCNHTGRTPPCTAAIMASGINRVVVGMADPNPRVTGGGSAFLAGQGVAVRQGVLEEECQALNRPFIKHSKSGLPWVIMKAGVSLDGRIATATGHSGWITNEQSRRHVHRMRDRVDAIMIGVGTALADDPSLTTRLPRRRGRDPLRVILDSTLRLPATARMLQQQSVAPTWVYCSRQAATDRQQALETAGAVVKRVGTDTHGGLALAEVLADLGEAQITSVLVEGGGTVHGSLLRDQLADQAAIFVAPVFLGGDGVPLSDSLGLQRVEQGPRLLRIKSRRFGDDLLIEGFFRTE